MNDSRRGVFDFAREGGIAVADIKTRDITRGTIKTLDRAASSMHHLKEETIRSKAVEIGNGYDNESVGSYEQETAVHYAGDGAAFAAKAGVELIQRSRGKTCSSEGEIDELIQRNSQNPTEIATYKLSTDEKIQHAFREQGIKTIRDRKSRAKMTDEEVLRNTEHDRLTYQIRRTSIGRQEEKSLRRTGRIAKNRQKLPQSADPIQLRRKEYAIKRMTDRRASTGIIGKITGRSSVSIGQGAKKTERTTANILKGSKALLDSASIGAVIATLVIVVMVFFGAALNMTEDGSYINGTGDGNIVEVAKAQIGNVGGDKFWKWYGFNSHVHWCACFVSWCGDQCGYIEDGIIPKFAVVGNGASWFKSRHRWSGRGYSPHPGDIIFFDYEQDGVLDHVGIVESCDGKTVVTIEGNSGNACKRQTYVKGSLVIAGYGCPAYQTISFTGGNASIWAAKIAADNSYHYVNWVGSDEKTHQCPICHNLTTNKYKGWNCIGFAFACWRHGYGINCNCNCGVIDDGQWNKLLQCKTDVEANKMATKLVGVPCVVIRNGGKAIPVSMLKSGDIIGLYNGSTYFHTAFYEGNGKYADCTSGRSDNIQSNNTMSKSTRSKIKVAIRYAG